MSVEENVGILTPQNLLVRTEGTDRDEPEVDFVARTCEYWGQHYLSAAGEHLTVTLI